MEYFTKCANVGQIKKLYRVLAMQWHPDRGGDNETMKQINLAYERMLASSDGEVSQGFDDKPHTYRYNAKIERDIMNKIAETLASLGSLVGDALELELIGTWLWVSGDTKPNKELLKALKFRWNGRRKMWSWHRPGYKARPTTASMNAIRSAYGSRTFESETGLTV